MNARPTANRALRRVLVVLSLGLSTRFALAGDLDDGGTIARVQSQQLEVHFQTPDPGLIRSAELWYTFDRGATWKRFDFDVAQRRSPLIFNAPKEGLYGFFIIVRNDAGASSPPPKPGTAPQQWAFMDWVPPLVQLHVAEKAESFAATRLVALRWTAYDAHLRDRPVDIYYMVHGQRLWRPIELRLPNSGRYDWRVPDPVGGELMVKIAVSDQGGHVVERFSELMTIDAALQQPVQAIETPPRVVAPRVMANRSLDLGSMPTVATGTETPSPPTPATRPAQTIKKTSKPTAPAPSPRATTSHAKPAPPSPPTIHTVRSQPRAVARMITPERTEKTTAQPRLPVRNQAAAPPEPAQLTDSPGEPTRRPTTVAAAIVEASPSALQGPSVADPPPSPTAQDHPPTIDAERALRLYQAGTYHRLRGLHGQSGDLAVAALRYQEAIREDPTFLDARQDLAGVLLLQGKHAEAAQMYGQILSMSPNHQGALEGKALALVRASHYEPARQALQRLVDLDPKNAEAWLHLGDVRHKMGDVRGAREAWDKAAIANPKAEDVVERARRRLATYTALPLTLP
ncbi:MAG: tetratricopeptide repeat protein [Phycisphaerae bacterium]|nr:tetratricopeptide repeat protein [Phycisphaerae bacterium]